MENENLSNFSKWRAYTDGLTSPDSFINFGFYFMISASLQRRVWLPPSHKPIFLNMYKTLVAPPGVGKGLVLTEISKFLRHHKLEDPFAGNSATINGSKTGNIESVDRVVLEATAQADYLSGKHEDDRGSIFIPKNKSTSVDKPLLIPMAADATSYEALVASISRALRRKNYYEWDAANNRQIPRIYTHSSVCFCLEELSSLFRKKAEDVARFLQITFDCGDYKKDTKTQGVDRIQRCCVNMIAGATPDFMRKLFRDGLADEGFASRSIFIYEPRDRKTAAFIPELNEHQKACEADILAHIKKLTTLYGQLELTNEAREYIEDWWRRTQISRPNTNERLAHYYARKKVHVLKLAAAIHFAESVDMLLQIESCKQAVVMLDSIESKMHHALVSDYKNPYAQLGVKIINYLSAEGVTPKLLNELRAKFWEDLPNNNPHEALDKTLEHYIITGKIRVVSEKDGKNRYTVLKEGRTEDDNTTKD